jgi:predicted RNA-binding protein YlxR (DUF448 family)
LTKAVKIKEKKIPLRRCVGCMESKPKRELIRIASSDGGAFVDESGRANGRGIYLCQNEVCFDAARKKRAVGRGLGIESPNADSYEKLKEEFMAIITDEEATE